MALFKCPECGHQVSDKASSCPNCGCPIEIIKNQSNVDNNQNNNNTRAPGSLAKSAVISFTFASDTPTVTPEIVHETEPETPEETQKEETDEIKSSKEIVDSYINGFNIYDQKDPSIGKYFDVLVNANEDYSNYYLGLQYALGIGKGINFEEAAKLFSKVDIEKYPLASPLYLYCRFYLGEGKTILNTAIENFNSTNHATDAFALGCIYYRVKDFENAIKHLTFAFENLKIKSLKIESAKFLFSCFHNSDLRLKTIDLQFKYLRYLASNNCNAYAQYLADIYSKGTHKNIELCEKYSLLAFKKGSDDAALLLYNIEKERGNQQKADYYLQEAINLGNPRAFIEKCYAAYYLTHKEIGKRESYKQLEILRRNGQQHLGLEGYNKILFGENEFEKREGINLIKKTLNLADKNNIKTEHHQDLMWPYLHLVCLKPVDILPFKELMEISEYYREKLGYCFKNFYDFYGHLLAEPKNPYRDMYKAVEMLKQAVLGDDIAYSCFLLGYIYYYGTGGYPVNKQLGIQYLKKGACLGDKQAIETLKKIGIG